MRIFIWLAVICIVAIAIACVYPWVIIESVGITVTGFDESTTNYGKRGYAHVMFTGLYLLFLFIPRLWAKRTNIFLGAINLAWAVSHFLVFRCEAGECPEKQPALWIVLISSIILLIATFFPGLKQKTDSNK